MAFKKIALAISLLTLGIGSSANDSQYKTPIENSLTVTVQLGGIREAEPLILKVFNQLFDTRFTDPLPDSKPEVRKDQNGNYVFYLKKIKQPVYITLEGSFSYKNLSDPFLEREIDSSRGNIKISIIELYLAEPGDNIKIDLIKDTKFKLKRYSAFAYYSPSWSHSNFRIVFSGAGASKYICRYQMDEVLLSTTDQESKENLFSFSTANYYKLCKEEGYKLLNRYKSRMNNNAFQVLKIDFYSALEMERVKFMPFGELTKDSLLFRKSVSNYKQETDQIEKGFSAYARSFSPIYAQFVLQRILIGKNLKRSGTAEVERIINDVTIHYSGALRDKMLTFLGLRLPLSKDFEMIFDRLLGTIEVGEYKEALNSFLDKNLTGKPAYLFSLPDANGRIYNLKDFAGKVVFIDFWFTGCGFCAQYYDLTVSKVEKAFRNNNEVVFITVNIDGDRNDWLKGLDEGIYTGPEIINLSSGGENNPIVKNYRVSSAPRPLLIDRKGRIFSNSHDELRGGGVAKLTETINRALTEK